MPRREQYDDEYDDAPPPPPRRRQARYEDDDDDYQERRPRRASYPGTVTAAGVIWIILGALGILNALAGAVLRMAAPDPRAQQDGAYAAGQLIGVVIGVLIGVAFILAGIQAVTGKLSNSLSPGIASVVLALFGLCIGGIAAIATTPILLVVVLIAVAPLLTSGILAIAGNSALKRYNQGGRSGRRAQTRRRPRDDDYDDE